VLMQMVGLYQLGLMDRTLSTLEKGVSDKIMNSFIVIVLNIRKAFIPCTRCLELYIPRIYMIILLTTSICQSI
jgi:hypothetical protein